MAMLLLVEDNTLFRSTLREALGRKFPTLVIDEASDLAVARLKLRVDPPDLALLDIQLPDGNGLDFAALMLADWPGIPVAICTSHDLPEYREAAGRIGVHSFLVKQNLDWGVFSRFVNGGRSSPPKASDQLHSQ